MGTSPNNENRKQNKKENDNIKHIYIDINLKDSNTFNQESTVDKIQNGNSDSASQQLNSNVNENKIGNASNEFSVFNSTNFKQDIEIEKEKGKEKENETKKGNIDPFSGGQIDQNPTKGNSPTKKDNVYLFSGGQFEKDTPENTENTTKGRNIDMNNINIINSISNYEKYNKDNNIDNSNINFSSIDNINNNNNIDNSNVNNNNIDNRNVNNNNIDNSNIKDKEEEDEKIYTNDKFEEDKKEEVNEEIKEIDEKLKISANFNKIKDICEKEGKFPFFLKISDNKPEFLLVSKNQSLSQILKMRNIDDRNISIFCRANQVLLDETFEKQNLKNFCIIEINEVF